MAKDEDLCIMPDCQRPRAYKISKLCHACYSFTRRWHGRSRAQILQRQELIEFWAKRIQTIIPEQRPQKKRKKA